MAQDNHKRSSRTVDTINHAPAIAVLGLTGFAALLGAKHVRTHSKWYQVMRCRIALCRKLPQPNNLIPGIGALRPSVTHPGPTSVLLVQGPPGCGVSTLMSQSIAGKRGAQVSLKPYGGRVVPALCSALGISTGE